MRAIKIFGSACVVYLAIAACSGVSTTMGNHAGQPGDDGGSLLDSLAAVGDAIGDAVVDPTGDAHADTVSGSRLKAKSYVGDDGSKQFVGWYDSARKEDCGFGRASDGATRCLPSGGAQGGTAFTNVGCTTPIGLVAKGCGGGGTVSYVAIYDVSNACAPVTHIYPATPYAGSTFYTKSGASCAGPTSTSGLTATYDLFVGGAEIAPSSFVAATIQTAP